jgi:hypothetical protein
MDLKGKGGRPAVSGETFLTETELAARQHRSVKTIRNERLTGRGIPFVKFGRSVRYRLADVIIYEDAHLRTSTSDQGGGS